MAAALACARSGAVPDRGQSASGSSARNRLDGGLQQEAGASSDHRPAHEVADGQRVLVGNAILECGSSKTKYAVTDARRTPANTRIALIDWDDKPLLAPERDGNADGRECRLSSDGVHLVCNDLDLKNLTQQTSSAGSPSTRRTGATTSSRSPC
ncbi:hypothetical protein [Streptomyces sp. NPDC058385]|uniref:hypothetical protein n=1 Tax=Streptomyces sp. NPDC058385 TaxID=3346473 RepID=UPI00365DDE97